MADVKPFGTGSPQTRRERAQLLIVIGIVVAISLVSLALFLNSIIYAENVGSRGADIGGGDATEFVNTVERAGQELLKDARKHEDEEYAFNRSIETWNEQARLHYTSSGVYTNVAVDHIEDDGSSARLNVTYENSQIDYRTTITVDPGETDD